MSSDGYWSLLTEAESRFEDRKSVFLGFAKPVTQEAEALDFITSVKKKYPDARHHVYAYALREGNKFRYTDDGEPAGTAGMPTLDAIRKRELTDCVVVVVRYFGGTLLGTGGLVHAYSVAAKDALTAAVPIRYDKYAFIRVEADYTDYQKIDPILKKYEVLNCEYGVNVVLTLRVLSDSADELMTLVRNATAARVKTEIAEEKTDYSNFYEIKK